MSAAADGAVERGLTNGDCSALPLQPLLCARLVALVRDRSTPEELGAWLKVPLEHAVAMGDKDLATQLILAGVSGDPITAAVKGGQHDLVQHLLVHCGEIVRRGGFDGGDIQKGLVLAAKLGYAQVVSLLSEHGADINARAAAEGFKSALDLAALGGHTEVISVIAERGGPESVNAADVVTGYSALHLAAKHNQARSIDALIEGGAELELEDRKGYTPLHVAATFDSEAAIRALLRHGAEIDTIATDDMLSPVGSAITEGHKAAVAILLAAGADVTCREGGKSGLDHAVWASQDVAGSQDGEDSGVGHDTLERRMDVVRILLQHGADAAEVDSGGYTALHTAAWLDLVPAIDLLVEAGANLEAKLEENEHTPLLVATADAGNVAAIKALVSHGANIHAREVPTGNTPLHGVIVDDIFEESPATVDALLKAGADETMLNDAGLTPLQLFEDGDDAAAACPEVERVRSLLTNAPQDRADRAWGRRALFVLCRALPDRMRLASAGSSEGGASQSPVVDNATADEAAIPGKRKKEVGRLGGTIGETIRSMNGGGACGFSAAMGKLIELQEDCIFREIVGFL